MLNILTYQNPVFKDGAINVWPHQSHKTELLQSMLNHKKGLSTKLNARDCTIVELTSSDSHLFLEANHLNGSTRTIQYGYGLIHNNELIQVVTLGVPRQSTKNISLEVLRMATLNGHLVRGGASKLFNYIKIRHTGNLLTYSDNMIGDGAVYAKAGFTAIGNTAVGYFWEKNGQILSRQKTMKGNLPTLFDCEIDLRKTESQIMHEQGWMKILDRGNKRWVMELSPEIKQSTEFKFHYVYKITRNDGYFYYGMHSTNNENDGYMGSGDLIRASIKKHGISFHNKEIIKECTTRLEASQLEASLVTSTLLKDPLCMNLIPGGGTFLITSTTIGFTWLNLKSMNVEMFTENPEPYLLNGWTKGRLSHKNFAGKWYVDDNGRQRRGVTDKPSQRLEGTTTGCTWVTRDGKRRAVKEVLPTDLVGFMPNVSKGKKKVIIDGVQKFVSVEEAVGLPKPPPTNTGKVGMRLGDVKKLVSLDEARILASQGWEIATKQLKSAPPQVLILAQELGMKLPKKRG